MDAASTLQIPRIVVSSLDQQQGNENEQTMVVQHPLAQSQPTQSQPSPRPPHQPYAPPQQHHHPQQQQHPSPLPRQASPQEHDPEGKVPTVQQPPKPRRTMSERLDGTL